MCMKLCVVTATRAEYGLLKPVIDKINRSNDLELQLVVTGMHLSPEFGLTFKEIEADGYPVAEKIEILLSSDTAVGITKSMAIALMGFGGCFERLQPDMVIILGDRYEMLAVASAAMIAKIPIAHIHGGEITEGAIDDSIRHSITKMSQLHFTATEEYRHRVIQLGENPQRVFNVGALGVENIKEEKLLSRKELEDSIRFMIDRYTIIVTYHPVTLEDLSSENQFNNLLDYVDKKKKLRVIFTKANSDTDGRIINQMIDQFVNQHKDRCVAFSSLGRLRYLSTLQFCAAVVGNSSSGIIEAPSFKIPTIDIGNRQKGRICSETIIHCGYKFSEIEQAFEQAFSEEFQKKVVTARNPYDKIGTSNTIINTIREFLVSGIETKKEFYDVNFTE